MGDLSMMMGTGLGQEEEKNPLDTTTGRLDQSKLYEEDLLNTCEIYK